MTIEPIVRLILGLFGGPAGDYTQQSNDVYSIRIAKLIMKALPPYLG